MDESTHLATLRKCLAQCEEALPEIHDHHDRQILEDHATLLRTDIKRMEEWEQKQDSIRSVTSVINIGDLVEIKFKDCTPPQRGKLLELLNDYEVATIEHSDGGKMTGIIESLRPVSELEEK